MLNGKKMLWMLFAIAVLAFLPACGGGGGGGGGELREDFDSIEPVPNPGRDQYVKVGDTVQLDGSGSLTPSGGALTYAWLFISRPAASAAELSDAGAVNPTFVTDMPGDYQLILNVNDGFMANESAPVTINATLPGENAPPNADAGNNQNVATGSTVVLNGSKSNDADGDDITYSWNIDSQPVGSFVTLLNSTSVEPSFVASHEGVYVVKLTVSDGTDSTEDTVSIRVVTPSSVNNPPVAIASIVDPGAAAVGENVTLAGSGSTDPDGDPLTYSWIFKSRPTGSSAVLSGANGINPTFTPDRAGIYEVTLTVSDGLLSDSDTLSVEGSYAPLFSMEGDVMPAVTDVSGNSYIKDTSINATITNKSLVDFVLLKAELYSKSVLLSSVSIDKILQPGAQESGTFTLKEGDTIEVDGIMFWYYLEHSITSEKIIIMLLYIN